MRVSLSVLSSLFMAGVLAQTTPPKSANVDQVIGHYRFKSGSISSVEKSGETLIVTSTGQPPQSISASADGKFSYAAIPAYLTFDGNGSSPSKTLTFHYDDRTLEASRIDAAEAKKVADAWQQKIKDQTHDPACANTLKRLIGEIRSGKPDFDKMTLGLAQATRTQLPMMQSRFEQLGDVKEVKFLSVAPNGAEQFDVAFEKGATQWRILCLPNGYVAAVGFR